MQNILEIENNIKQIYDNATRKDRKTLVVYFNNRQNKFL